MSGNQEKRFVGARSWNWWWRAHHGLPFDSKLAVIAKRCAARRGDVAAVWVAVLDFASQHEDRGSVAGIDAEEIAVSYDYDPEYVAKIFAAFEEKGMIAADRVTAWEWRQVQREREDNSTERVRAYRVRQAQRNSETRNADETDAVSDTVSSISACETLVSHPETPCNAPEQSRTEQSRAEQNTHTNACVRVTPRAADLTENDPSSEKFAEVWEPWPLKIERDAACQAWLSLVTRSNEAKVIACSKRFLGSDQVARGVVPKLSNWLYQAKRDDWAGDWPTVRGSSNVTRQQKIEEHWRQLGNEGV